MSGSIPNRRIFIQDVIDGDGVIDAERLLFVTNTFMEAVYILFDQNIEHGDHINDEIIELTFNTAVDYVLNDTFAEIVFPINIKGKRVQGVILARIQDVDDINKIFTTPITLTWGEKDDKLKITFITGLEDNKSYAINVLVI